MRRPPYGKPPGPGFRRGRTPRLRGCPQARGLVVRVCVMNPKKPNSAMRHVAKMKLYGKPRVTARIPGRGFGASKFNRCLVRGGRANDLPGVGYSLVRGVYDFAPLFGKRRRRSFYGVERSAESVTFIRRKLRRRGVSRLRAGSYPAQLGAIPRPRNPLCGGDRVGPRLGGSKHDMPRGGAPLCGRTLPPRQVGGIISDKYREGKARV